MSRHLVNEVIKVNPDVDAQRFLSESVWLLCVNGISHGDLGSVLLGMEAWGKVDSRKIQDRFLVHVGIRRRETIYIACIVAEMELVNGIVGLAGERLAW
jgi:hypothetical protein